MKTFKSIFKQIKVLKDSIIFTIGNPDIIPKIQLMKTIRLHSIILSFVCIKVFGQKPVELSYYLGNKEISKAAKNYYYRKFSPSDDRRTLSLLDSLKTHNNSTRPFYIYLVSTMLEKADGALSEALGNVCNDFIESHPNQALDFLYSTNDISSSKFIDLWAIAVAGEFMIDCEGKV